MFGKNQILNRGQKLKIWCLAKGSSLKFNLWQGSNLEILCLGRPNFETVMFKWERPNLENSMFTKNASLFMFKKVLSTAKIRIKRTVAPSTQNQKPKDHNYS